MQRGEIWWAELPDPEGAQPGFRRPVLVVQADPFTQSRIATVIVVAITSNTRLAAAPGNVLLRAGESGLPRDSVVNVSQIITLDKRALTAQAGKVAPRDLDLVDYGLRLALDL